MPRSARYRLLEKRLTQLRARMLPAKFSPTGVYSDRQLDWVRGYRVLVHAEIEAYLEDSVRQVATQVFEAWMNDKKPHHTIICLLAFCKVTGKTHPSASTYVGEARANLKLIIDANHGIKEENLVKFLPPIGIDCSTLDQTWLSTMTSFGKRRGEVAHTSVKTHQPIDPLSEYQTVGLLLVGLRELDEKLRALTR
jgi:hypothetical protein